MKKLSVIFLFLLCATGAFAQTQTAVSATVTDPNGIPYANGTFSIQLIPAGTNPSVGGAAIQGAFNGSTSATGSFSISLWPNASITPGSTQWSFTICSNSGGIQPPLGTGTQCTPPTAITVSGTAQVLSTTLSNVAPKLTNFAGVGTVTTTGSPATNLFAVFTGLTSIGPASPCPLVQPASNPTAGQILSSAAPSGGTCQTNWISPSAGSGTISGTTGQSAYFSATNTITGGTVVLDMAGIAGADLGAKMNNCATALPSGGGTCKGDNLSGAQTLSTAVTTAKPVVYTFCGQAVSQSANVNLNATGSALTGCPGQSTTFTKAANIDQFTVAAGALRWLTIIGVAASFTGNGIVTGNSNAVIEHNAVNGEAGAGISNAGGGLVQFNVVSSGSTGHAITDSSGAGRILYNTVNSSASDAIYVSANDVLVQGNQVTLNPAASTSGLCGINFNADQIGDRSLANQITINDSTNSGNVDLGVCDTPIGTHNLDMLFSGDYVQGVFSGTVTAYGYEVNNAAGLGNNWSVLFRDEHCVHVGAPITTGSCVRSLNTQPVTTIWEDIQLGDGQEFDGTTTDIHNLLIQRFPALSFAGIPTNGLAPGSVVECTDCTPGAPVTSGGFADSSIVTGFNGHPATLGKSFYVTLASVYTNSTTSNTNLLAIPVDPNIYYVGYCQLYYQAAATGGLNVSFTTPTSINYLLASISMATSSSASYYASNGSTLGAPVVTANTNFPAFVTFSFLNGGNAGTLQLQAASSSTATLTVQKGSFCFGTQQ